MMMKAMAIPLSLAAALLAIVAVSTAAPARAQGVYAPPTNVRVADGADPGTATISWDVAHYAVFYRIGWVSSAKLAAVRAAGRDWQDAFTFTDVAHLGPTTHTLTDLAPGARYAFSIGSLDHRYGYPLWSEWVYLTLAAAPATSCPTAPGEPAATPAPMPTPAPPAPTPSPTPMPTPTLQPTPVGTDSYDADQDGLIEVANLAQLDAIRYDLNGDGVSPAPAYAAAFPNAMPGMGCPDAGCAGYELVADLDFDTNGNGEADVGDAYWNDGAGWAPIGDSQRWFYANFDGNNHTIANLYIDRSDANDVGLFGYVLDSSIEQVGLESVAAAGRVIVGGLVGHTDSSAVSSSYVTGSVSGNALIGGLVGHNNFDSPITASYATGIVAGGGMVGGLVGYNEGSTITGGSYAKGSVLGNSEHSFSVGGLVGHNSGGAISSSYAMGSVSGGNDNSDSIGGLVGYNAGGTITSGYATGRVSGGKNVGGLVGYNYSGGVSSSYATGRVSGNYWVGGLVGVTERGTISNSYATGSVIGSDNVGGLVGSIFSSAISDSYATGRVAGSGAYHVGGLVGANSSSAISGSYATGSVTGGSEVGGLVGHTEIGTISNSYAAGRVSGKGDAVGGLAGWNAGSAIIASYAVGYVSTSGDTSQTGGLVGYDESDEVTASYWDTQTTRQSHSPGGGVGKTTAELQSPTGPAGIYATWDADYWDFGAANQYPVLKHGSLNAASQR